VKSAIIGTCVIIALLGGVFVYNYKQSSSNQTVSIVERIKEADAQLIDVRTADEYIADHASGATNIPLDNILSGNFKGIDKDKPIYVYCRSGMRAGQAKIALEKLGYKNVTNLGGINNWKDQGGKTCKTNTTSC
jgi:phage shock protein E